jgi:hypothetical protein
MHPAGQAILLALQLVATTIGPGLLLVRRLRLSPLEKLCTAVAASVTLQYLWQFTSRITLSAPRWTAVLGVAIALTCLIAARRDALRLLHNRRIRQAVVAFSAITIACVVFACAIRCYSGGDWARDWLEHYERARFFLGDFPADRAFALSYPMPARPPLQNAATAFEMALFAREFWVFQIVTIFQSALVVLACWLIAGRMGTRASLRSPALLIALLITTPMVVQNITWTWTKMLAAFEVIVGLSLYLAAWRKNDFVRFLLAFLCMTAAILVHYSSGIYGLFLIGHFFYRSFRDQRRAGEWLMIGVSCSALLATWFAYAAIVFRGGVVTATSTAQQYADAPLLDRLLAPLQVMFNTIVPFWLRGQTAVFGVQHNLFNARDVAFDHYQTNFVFSFGLLAATAIAWLMWRGRVDRFWLMFTAFVYIVGCAVVPPPPGVYGSAHVCVQPLTLLGITFLAGQFSRLPRWAQLALGLSRIVDYAAGVVLHLYAQSINTEVVFIPGDSLYQPELPMNRVMLLNFYDKKMLAPLFLSDLVGHRGITLALWIAAVGVIPLLILLLRRPTVLAGVVTPISPQYGRG